MQFWLITALLGTSIPTRAAGVPCPIELARSPGRFDRVDVSSVGGKVIIPIYSDVHGRLEMLFQSLGLLQKKTRATYPVVFITGDLGWFPYPGDLPDPIKRIEIKSATDLGFARFNAEEATGKSADGGRRTLRERYFRDAREPLRLDAKFYFLRGNHEDHELLKDREASGRAITPADPGATFNYLSDGSVIQLETPDGAILNIGILGGIHRESRPGRAVDNPLMTFDEPAVDRLLNLNAGTIDVLLTHQGPAATHGGHGEIDSLIEVLRPKVHVHGHSGSVQTPLCLGGTESRCVPDLDRPRDHTLAIEWDPATNHVRLVHL